MARRKHPLGGSMVGRLWPSATCANCGRPRYVGQAVHSIEVLMPGVPPLNLPTLETVWRCAALFGEPPT